ncbi:MAG TPA: hypothetical protein VM582_05825, partial [Candidatus Thermoplasmatota archaeon]|nr:hypothetical protein [Candidatus Thermoplasmatota archaeon]
MATLKPFRLLALALLLAACLPLAFAGGVIAQAALYESRMPEGACEAYPLEPFDGLRERLPSGSAILRLTNTGAAATARVCLFDGSGTKRYDERVELAAAESRDIVVEAPPGVYTFRAEAAAPGGARTSGQGTLTTFDCVSGSGDTHMTFFVGPEGAGGSAWGGGCVPGSLAVGLVGVFLGGGALLAAKSPPLAAFVLYSRLARPRLLDAGLRQRLHDLVASEPGIHTREIVRALGAGDGQAAYHLGVLAREKLIVAVRMRGMTHWFVNGRYPPTRARAIALLRDGTRRRIYDAVRAAPGVSLGEVAHAADVSLSQASTPEPAAALADAVL